MSPAKQEEMKRENHDGKMSRCTRAAHAKEVARAPAEKRRNERRRKAIKAGSCRSRDAHEAPAKVPPPSSHDKAIHDGGPPK
ncbi:hypothetical protein HPP92_006847 [Vanilla planifolia]|uniref:Uncharacterized protein n=1 Tax=Vanilla planifolia TaxID=51239 RepID=A0A835V755_VANPL|nr:hypothetical protein HPP92_006847 [Vanilla planifolia]